MEVQQRLLIITGALRGLGFELSKKLVSLGKYRLLLTSRAHEQNTKTLDQLQGLNKDCQIDYHDLDVTSTQSISDFAQWVADKYKTFDVLVNNAGLIDRQAQGSDEEKAKQVFSVNFFGVINVTESLVKLLSPDGKVLIISSLLGQLSRQNQSIQELLNTELTKDQIVDKAQELIELRKLSQFGQWDTQYEPVYCASKALINCYGRFELPRILQQNQSSFLIHPGWCQTSMGGSNAPLSAEEGIVSMLHVIDNIPFGRDPLYHARFYNQDGSQFPEF